MTAEIDRAIRKTNLGLNPVSDGKILKVWIFRDLAVADELSPGFSDGTVDRLGDLHEGDDGRIRTVTTWLTQVQGIMRDLQAQDGLTICFVWKPFSSPWK